jgi:hypothetical protein
MLLIMHPRLPEISPVALERSSSNEHQCVFLSMLVHTVRSHIE